MLQSIYNSGICIILCAIGCAAQQNLPIKSNHKYACTITDSTIFGLKIGDKVEDLKLISGIKLERTSDGDGAALISVKFDSDEVAIIWANEDNFESPINYLKSIITIITNNPNCKMSNGIHPGSMLKDLEMIYGNNLTIQLSEIESREYVISNTIPYFLSFRVDGAGVFNKEMQTKKYDRNAKISSISITKK